jgi:hypothetical protein
MTANSPRIHHIVCEAFSDLMANLADYDALEVHPVEVNAEPDGSTWCQVCSAEEADIWSVYAHLPVGEVMCVGDFETQALANAYADALSGKLGLPVTHR